MKLVKIENWSITNKITDPYKAPEQGQMRLVGEVYGHPTQKDGSRVMTSTLCGTDGRMITTKHNIYILGTVDKDYKEWIESIGETWDDNYPIQL